MNRLQTDYLGLKLKSPVIIGSSSLTSSLSRMKQAEDSGAGAIIMKSLFEEQINNSIASVPDTSGYPEAGDYISWYIRNNAVDEYLDLIREATANLDIPVIPSINCSSSDTWIEFAKKIEAAGAAAIEINMFYLPTSKKISAPEVENQYFRLIERLIGKVSIPISLKIGPRFSNILYMVDQFYTRGVKGVVMFNRFYEPDIDPEELAIIAAPVFSTVEEMRYVIRWIAMASAMDIKINISASTGVRSGNDVVKYLLAGADTVQVCSILYQKGIPFIKSINDDIINWMDKKGFGRVSDFRGKLNYSSIEKSNLFERTQFMKHFSSHE
jgi:dihydroorotate dehydrogenase (fumarate)